MVLFQNISYDLFNKIYKDKKIICFGGGGTLDMFFQKQRNNVFLLKKIKYIINNDENENKKSRKILNKEIAIVNINDIIKFESINKNYVCVLLVSNENIINVIKQLDMFKVFNDMPCIYGISAMDWGHEIFKAPVPATPKLPIIKKEYSIPKVIHYCWFGKGKIPKKNIECIESWKKKNIDFEIKLWNEFNYDLTKSPKYVKDAYKAKKYAFVSDYVRLDIIYNHGGFYFDTDVELLKSINDFVKYKSVFSFMEYGEIATGLGFGSIAKTKEIKALRDMYEMIDFYNENGEYNLMPCPTITNYYFRKLGIIANNQMQMKNGILILPSSFFCPLNPMLANDGKYNLTLYALMPNSYGIHKCDNSWKNDLDKMKFEEKKEEFKEINERLLRDWKICNDNLIGG